MTDTKIMLKGKETIALCEAAISFIDTVTESTVLLKSALETFISTIDSVKDSKEGFTVDAAPITKAKPSSNSNTIEPDCPGIDPLSNVNFKILCDRVINKDMAHNKLLFLITQIGSNAKTADALGIEYSGVQVSQWKTKKFPVPVKYWAKLDSLAAPFLKAPLK